MSTGSIRASIYLQYRFPSHPGIDVNVCCNCREHTVRYISLCYPDSIRGYNPTFQTKRLVNTKKENYYAKHMIILTVEHSDVYLLSFSLHVHFYFQTLARPTCFWFVRFCFVPAPQWECVCLCLGGRHVVGKEEKGEVWRVGGKRASCPSRPIVLRESAGEEWGKSKWGQDLRPSRGGYLNPFKFSLEATPPASMDLGWWGVWEVGKRRSLHWDLHCHDRSVEPATHQPMGKVGEAGGEGHACVLIQNSAGVLASD